MLCICASTKLCFTLWKILYYVRFSTNQMIYDNKYNEKLKVRAEIYNEI